MIELEDFNTGQGKGFAGFYFERLKELATQEREVSIAEEYNLPLIADNRLGNKDWGYIILMVNDIHDIRQLTAGTSIQYPSQKAVVAVIAELNRDG